MMDISQNSFLVQDFDLNILQYNSPQKKSSEDRSLYNEKNKNDQSKNSLRQIHTNYNINQQNECHSKAQDKYSPTRSSINDMSTNTDYDEQNNGKMKQFLLTQMTKANEFLPKDLSATQTIFNTTKHKQSKSVIKDNQQKNDQNKTHFIIKRSNIVIRKNRESLQPNSSFKLPLISNLTERSQDAIENNNSINQAQNYNSNINSLETSIQSLKLTSKSYTIYDLTYNKIIYSYYGRMPREIASLTKIMTCYLVCNKILKNKVQKDTIIKVSRLATTMIGTTSNLQPGDYLSIWDLLHGLMMPSGNDAAYTLAEYVGKQLYFKSEEYKRICYENKQQIGKCKSKNAIRFFVNLMNKTSRELDLCNTQYANPHGLQNKFNRSSSEDICKLSALAMQSNPYFREIVKTKIYECTIRMKNGSTRIEKWENTNRMLWESEDCNGLKTGITPSAGPCLATCFTNQNRQFIIVILLTWSLELRYKEIKLLYDWICNRYGLKKPIYKPQLQSNNNNQQEDNNNNGYEENQNN